jgi:hypothetical protein
MTVHMEPVDPVLEHLALAGELMDGVESNRRQPFREHGSELLRDVTRHDRRAVAAAVRPRGLQDVHETWRRERCALEIDRDEPSAERTRRVTPDVEPRCFELREGQREGATETTLAMTRRAWSESRPRAYHTTRTPFVTLNVSGGQNAAAALR